MFGEDVVDENVAIEGGGAKNRPTMDVAHPYSQARAAGPFGFISGALSVDPAGRPVDGRRAALDAAIERMTERLASIGASLDDVIKVTYFVTDVTLRNEANLQFQEMFSLPRPARSFVEVQRLPYEATVEIEAITYRPEDVT